MIVVVGEVECVDNRNTAPRTLNGEVPNRAGDDFVHRGVLHVRGEHNGEVPQPALASDHNATVRCSVEKERASVVGGRYQEMATSVGGSVHV